MARSTIIFGNGLGMALNPDYFSINQGFENAWNNGGRLTSAHKKLIVSAIEGTSKAEPPKSEDQLDKLQIALFAADYLNSFNNEDVTWLNEHATELPSAFRQYLHDVALYFLNSNKELPNNFIKNLTEYLKDTKSHVATLNYDALLYDEFIKTKILMGYDGTLIDGFRYEGFSEEYLKRKKPNQLGWYLHLHGSPFYIGNKKSMREDRNFPEPKQQTHIVLTYIKHKPIIISASPILQTYWQKLDEAFDESDAIILFGYSGGDEHLNQKIQARSDDKSDRPILIVEWEGAGAKEERQNFWFEKTKSEKITLIHMANILDFTDWASCHEVAA